MSSVVVQKTVSFWMSNYCGVHFETINLEENTSSTSDFLIQEGKQWRYVATRFNCEEERSDGDSNVMNELLDLCNWYDNRERNPVIDFSDDEDSDSEIPFSAFSIQFPTPKLNSPTPVSLMSSTSTRVSSLTLGKLRLESKMNLKGPQQSRTSFKNHESYNDGDELELAFKGVMTNNCGVELDKSSVEKIKIKEENISDNFWHDVEF